MIVTDGSGTRSPAYLVPMTYRAEALAAADRALIGTSEHGVLGHRWIYDGTRDPVLVAQLVALLQGTAEPQAQNVSNTPDPAVTVGGVRVGRGGAASSRCGSTGSSGPPAKPASQGLPPPGGSRTAPGPAASSPPPNTCPAGARSLMIPGYPAPRRPRPAEPPRAAGRHRAAGPGRHHWPPTPRPARPTPPARGPTG